MDRNIISEDVEIELNGKIVKLEKGTSFSVQKPHKVDLKFKINTNDGTILVESGDSIHIGGKYVASSSSQFISNGKLYEIEKGDKFDIIEEGAWDDFKRGVLGQDTAAEEMQKMLNGLIRAGHLIAVKAERVYNDKGDNRYERLLKSEEMNTINELVKLNKDGYGIGEILDVLDLKDPKELVKKIRDELIRIGDKRLAQRIIDVIPTNVFGKAWNLFRKKMAKGELTSREQKPKSDIQKRGRLLKIWNYVTKNNDIDPDNFKEVAKKLNVSIDEVKKAIGYGLRKIKNKKKKIKREKIKKIRKFAEGGNISKFEPPTPDEKATNQNQKEKR